MTYPTCSGGSCRQGRAKCETPHVCHVPLPDDDIDEPILTWRGFVVCLLAVALLGLCIGFGA